MTYFTFHRRAGLVIAIMSISFVLPIGLEQLGYLSSTWEIRDGKWIMHSGALAMESTRILVLAVIATVATFVMAGIHASRSHRTSQEAQRQLVTQAWHLQQLLPKP
jgi:hypothetical protein